MHERQLAQVSQSNQLSFNSTTSNDVAVFLDLDNLVIGAKQANLEFDINLLLNEIKRVTNGRIVLRRSYGDWRQGQKLLKDLATAGFTTQSTVRLNSYSKNLADMQIVVDTMDTLIDGHQYNTYVLITGDRDFTPLVQSLRKRGKHVIGVGIKHTASASLVGLCDLYIYYESLVPQRELTESQIEELLAKALDELLQSESRVRASILKQHMSQLSKGMLDKSPASNGSFRKFLGQYPHLVEIEQEETTIYVKRPSQTAPNRELYKRYRTGLKKQKLRVVPAAERFLILKTLLQTVQAAPDIQWRDLVDTLADKLQTQNDTISKNKINAVMLLARQAEILTIEKETSLSQSPVQLSLQSERPFQDAILRCDKMYLREILDLDEPFDVEEASLALYGAKKHSTYLQKLMKGIDKVKF